jgi:hypothetical protein
MRPIGWQRRPASPWPTGRAATSPVSRRCGGGPHRPHPTAATYCSPDDEPQILYAGLSFAKVRPLHGDRLWVSRLHTHRVLAIDDTGGARTSSGAEPPLGARLVARRPLARGFDDVGS